MLVFAAICKKPQVADLFADALLGANQMRFVCS